MGITFAKGMAKKREEEQIKHVIGIKFEGYTEADVDKVISCYESMVNGPNTKIVTPIVTVIDLSGSMTDVFSQMKLTMKTFDEEIKKVGKRDLFFILIAIYNNEPRIIFCDSVMVFSADELIKALPEKCAGKTPLAGAVALSDRTLEKLYALLDRHNLWYTIPVHLCITDAITTEKDSEYMAIVDKYQRAVFDNEKIVFEFVTQKNNEGIRLGGYRIFVDERNYSKNIGDFMHSLALASTSDKVNNQNMKKAPDRWKDREAYNRFMSAVTITNFRNSFENNY